jgi:hypothetical protein
MNSQPASEKSIFEAAIERSLPAERAAYLDQACGGDQRLREEVEALLAAHDRLGKMPEAARALNPVATADEPLVAGRQAMTRSCGLSARKRRPGPARGSAP